MKTQDLTPGTADQQVRILGIYIFLLNYQAFSLLSALAHFAEVTANRTREALALAQEFQNEGILPAESDEPSGN